MIHQRIVTNQGDLERKIKRLRHELSQDIKDGVLQRLDSSPEIKQLWNLTSNNGSQSPTAFRKAINNSLSVKFEPLNDYGKGQVKVLFSSRKIKDILTNELDQFTYSKIRRRNDTRDCDLPFVGDLLDMRADGTVILLVDWNTFSINTRIYDPDNWRNGQVSFLQDIVCGAVSGISEAFKYTMESNNENKI
jgi:hypothetical protein